MKQRFYWATFLYLWSQTCIRIRGSFINTVSNRYNRVLYGPESWDLQGVLNLRLVFYYLFKILLFQRTFSWVDWQSTNLSRLNLYRFTRWFVVFPIIEALKGLVVIFKHFNRSWLIIFKSDWLQLSGWLHSCGWWQSSVIPIVLARIILPSES